MDSTKNFFEAWMNTQSQIAGKIKESFENNDVVSKSVELYKSWFDNQKSLADTMMTSIQNQNTPKLPEMVKQWIDAQTLVGSRLMEFLTQGTKPAPTASDNFMQTAKDWYENISRGLQTLMPNQTPTNSFMQMPQQVSSMINNAQTYLQMMDMWQKGYKMMQGAPKTSSLDDVMKMFDMNQYKQVLDGMFQFMTPEKSQNFLQQIQQYSQSIFDHFPQMQQFMNSSTGQFPKPEAFLNGGLNNIAEVYQNFSEEFHKFINPYFTAAPAGRDKEISSLMIQVQDKLTQYYIKTTEMQQLTYETGKKGIEKTLQKVMQKVGTNLEALPFDEFYNIWVDTMETDTIGLFGSKEYCTLQGKVVQLGLEIKGGLEKQMEQMLAPLPVVPRSEMDALNKTVHELKREIRALKQKKTAPATVVPTETVAKTEPEATTTQQSKTTTRKTTKKQ